MIPAEIEQEMITEDRDFESGSTSLANPGEMETIFKIDGLITIRPGQTQEEVHGMFIDFCAINGWTFDGHTESYIIDFYDETIEEEWNFYGLSFTAVCVLFACGVITSVLLMVLWASIKISHG